MRLQHLPVALLRTILNGDDSWAAIELWKCGDSELNLRLANKGVTDIILRDIVPKSTSRWPRCLAHFKLERLSVDRSNLHLCEPETLSLELGKLHSGLRELSLAALGASRAFFYEAPILKNLPSTASSQASNASKDAPQPHVLRNMSLLWPQLERLSIGDDTKFSSSRSYLSLTIAELFTALPPSLTWLEYRMGLRATPSDFNLAPRGLKTLHLPSYCIDGREA